MNTIQYFGQSAEIANCKEEQIDFPPNLKVENLLLVIYQNHPEMRKINIQIAVNKKIANAEEIVPEGAVIAILPPFAGG